MRPLRSSVIGEERMVLETASPPSEDWEEISRIILAWSCEGYLPGTPALSLRLSQARREPWPPASAEQTLQELEADGIPVPSLLKILRGECSPSVDVLRRYRLWCILRAAPPLMRQRHESISLLEKHSTSLNHYIRDDIALPADLTARWNAHYTSVRAALCRLKDGEDLRDLLRDEGFSVGPDHDFPRHDFWNQVSPALVEECTGDGRSAKQTFGDVARLLHAVFPLGFPNNPNLVQQRFYRVKRRSPAREDQFISPPSYSQACLNTCLRSCRRASPWDD